MDDLERFRWQLAGTIAWCARRVPAVDPKTGLRSPELCPANLYDAPADPRRSPAQGLESEDWPVLVGDLTAKRAELLRDEGGHPAAPAFDLAGGRLLLYDPDSNLCDGAAEVATGGFFDVDNIPPWDTWVDFVVERSETRPRQVSFALYLVAWVPPESFADANQGVDVNPEACICWAAELDKVHWARGMERPFIERLKGAGLAF